MQRWPSPKAMKRVRERVHELTDSRQSGKDVKQMIATLNPVLRGWGNYFRTGNSERKFNQLDSYVYTRLTHARHREVPGASHTSKIIVKPCAGKLHARFERGF
jgi:Group II intron, maturase-specific domain